MLVVMTFTDNKLKKPWIKLEWLYSYRFLYKGYLHEETCSSRYFFLTSELSNLLTNTDLIMDFFSQ